MSTIRINQRLREGYNPDGTPGTVSTGVEGAPGRAPTTEEIAVAVDAWLVAHPLSVEAVTASAKERNLFGSGAAGAPGTYVDIGSHDALHAFVTAGGTPQQVNLYLEAKNGQIVASGDTVVLGTLTAQGGLMLLGSNGTGYDVHTRLGELQAQITELGVVENPPDLVATFEAALI